MLIKIDTADVHMTIPLPSSILFSRMGASIVSSIIAKYANIEAICSQDQIRGLFRCLQQCRRHFPHLTLVDVQTADGEHVAIQL